MGAGVVGEKLEGLREVPEVRSLCFRIGSFLAGSFGEGLFSTGMSGVFPPIIGGGGCFLLLSGSSGASSESVPLWTEDGGI